MNKKTLVLSLMGLISFSSSQACPNLPKNESTAVKIMRVLENGAFITLSVFGAAYAGQVLGDAAIGLTKTGVNAGKVLGNFALESARNPQILKNAASKLAQDVIQNAPRIAKGALTGASIGVFGYTLLELYKLSNPL